MLVGSWFLRDKQKKKKNGPFSRIISETWIGTFDGGYQDLVSEAN